MSEPQLIVVGAGAAGLMAAGTAAKAGARTLLLEKNDAPGRKLLLTGNRRCNYTNTLPLSEFLARFRPNGQFLRNAFALMFSAELIEFFRGLGIEPSVEPDGKVFPASGKGKDVVDAMVKWAKDCGVSFQMRSAVSDLVIVNKTVVGVRLTDETTIAADAIILTTGGASYPSTGSSGDGYRIAEAAGHTIVRIRPALVPLETAGDTAQKLQGLDLDNVTIRMWVDGKRRSETLGEILFTHFGLSGPAVISLSGTVVDELLSGHKVALSIDLAPDLDAPQLDQTLIRQLSDRGKQKLATLLTAYVPKRLADLCMELNNIPPETLCSQLSADHRKKLRTLLKDFRFEITAPRPLDEAMVTAGGVATKEIDPRTMASRIIKNLYFAGEIIDIDADTGGFNLQAAFSTAALAATSAAS